MAIPLAMYKTLRYDIISRALPLHHNDVIDISGCDVQFYLPHAERRKTIHLV